MSPKEKTAVVLVVVAISAIGAYYIYKNNQQQQNQNNGGITSTVSTDAGTFFSWLFSPLQVTQGQFDQAINNTF